MSRNTWLAGITGAIAATSAGPLPVAAPVSFSTTTIPTAPAGFGTVVDGRLGSIVPTGLPAGRR